MLRAMVVLTRDVQLTSMHFYAWKKGLKTGAAPCHLSHLFFDVIIIFPVPGCYYLRTRAAVDAIKFTVDAAVAGRAFLRIFASAFVYFRPGNGTEGSAAKSKEQNMADMVRSVPCSVERS